MQLTREADYALRVMLEVASRPAGARATSAEVARRRLMPHPFVRKIVPRLVRAGLLRTRRGARGGLLLGRPARDIDLLAIVAAVQGVPSVNVCVLQPASCPLQPTCPVHEVCRLAQAQLTGLLSSVDLAALVRRREALQATHASV